MATTRSFWAAKFRFDKHESCCRFRHYATFFREGCSGITEPAKLLQNGLCSKVPVDLKLNAVATEHPPVCADNGTGHRQPRLVTVVDLEYCTNRHYPR